MSCFCVDFLLASSNVAVVFLVYVQKFDQTCRKRKVREKNYRNYNHSTKSNKKYFIITHKPLSTQDKMLVNGTLIEIELYKVFCNFEFVAAMILIILEAFKWLWMDKLLVNVTLIETELKEFPCNCEYQFVAAIIVIIFGSFRMTLNKVHSEICPK